MALRRGRPRLGLPAPMRDPVRVIRYPADARFDYFIPRERAKEMFELGILAKDIDNGCYTTYNSKMGNSAGPMLR